MTPVEGRTAGRKTARRWCALGGPISIWLVSFGACNRPPARNFIGRAEVVRPAPGAGDAACAVLRPRRTIRRRVAPILTSSPGAGFALNAEGDLVAFDERSGAILARYWFGRELVDACWDAHTGRVLVVERDGYSDGSRVHALRYEQGFTHESSSPPLPGAVRLITTERGILAVSDSDAGACWYRLGDDLSPAGPCAPLFRPASVVELSGGAELGLSSTPHHRGELWWVAPPSYGAVLLAPSAAERQDARLIAGGGRIWLAESQDGWLGIGEVPSLSPRLPNRFKTVALDAAGSVQAGVYDPEQAALTLLLASPSGAAHLLELPVDGAPARQLALLGNVQTTPWWSRGLARDVVTGELYVATDAGVFAWAPSGSALAPALAQDRTFRAPELRGPLVIPR